MVSEAIRTVDFSTFVLLSTACNPKPGMRQEVKRGTIIELDEEHCRSVAKIPFWILEEQDAFEAEQEQLHQDAAAFAAQWRVPQQQDKSSFHSPTSRLSQLCSVQEEGDEQEHTMQIFPEMILENPLDSPAGAQFSRASQSSFGFTPRADAVPFTPTSEVSGLNSAQRSQSACFNFQQVSDRASLAQMELFEPPVPFAPPALDRSQSQPDLGSNRRASKSEVRRSLKKIIRSQVKQQMKEEKQQQKLRNSLSSFDFSPVKREKPEKKLRCSMSAVSSSGSERRSPEETLEFFRHLQQLQAMQNSGYTSEVVSREPSFSGSQLAITA
mmetsp:Transcript_49865/g.97785  ORF Transcript_49865/g.97785 Transcript_49865/m.97785 type:complete len:326 (-) Transcript_49865:254-1231(-)